MACHVLDKARDGIFAAIPYGDEPMTISTALSPAREQAFQSTLNTQQKRGGHVQFSLPPVNDVTAPKGSSTQAASGAAALSRNLLPIAVPIAALNDSAPATPVQPGGTTPVTTGTGGPGVTLPIAPVGTTPASTLGATATGTVHNHGNLISARLISRLYQQKA
jgi:hypothetical protein